MADGAAVAASWLSAVGTGGRRRGGLAAWSAATSSVGVAARLGERRLLLERPSDSLAAARLAASLAFGELFFHPHHVVHAAGGAGEAEHALVDFEQLAVDAACVDVEPHCALHQLLHELRFDLGVDRREDLVGDFDRGDAVGDRQQLVVAAGLDRSWCRRLRC